AGLAVVLQTSELLFYGIKILGAAYLFYLAYQLWRADPHQEVDTATNKVGLWALARQEFLVAAGNPKAILIFTAFLPQFVVTGHPITAQFALLGV
ncbi:LysE family transporter, partial [Vibrio cholerae]